MVQPCSRAGPEAKSRPDHCLQLVLRQEDSSLARSTQSLGILQGRAQRRAELLYQLRHTVHYKIIELKFGDFEGPKVRAWIATNYPALKGDTALANEIANFENERGNEEPQKYLNSACRVAVAHSSVTNPSDPDELPELRRLHVAANILRALARRFIQNELGVSDCPYDGS